MRSVEDMLQGGAPVVSWKDKPEGYTVKGVLAADPVAQQDRDFETGEPKTWKDGRPIDVVIISLATDERDPSIPDDDGIRRLFAADGKNIWKAIRTAVQKSKGTFGTGGTLAVRYTGDDAPSKPGLNGAKKFVAQYEPPPARVDAMVSGTAEGSTPAEELF